MNKVQNILFVILFLGLGVLYFLHFKSSSNAPKVSLNPTQGDLKNASGTNAVFINTDTFFAKYTVYKNLEKEVEESQKSAQTNLQSKMKSLEADYMKLMQDAQSGKITPQQAQAKEKEMVARKQALDNESQKVMKSITDKGTKASDDLQKTLKEYFEKNKSKYNCDYVMGYQKAGGVLYVDPALDITNLVLEDLNK